MPVMAKGLSSTFETETPTQLEPPSLAASPLLQTLLNNSIIPDRLWEATPPEVLNQLVEIKDKDALLDQLLTYKLLTKYQARQVKAGELSRLVINNYRVLAHLGSGGMGDVFKADH